MPTSDWDAWTLLAQRREGVRYAIYRDSLGKLTGGIGHLITDTDPSQFHVAGAAIPPTQVDEWWAVDGKKAFDAAIAQAAEAGIDSSNFRVVLASVNYQLGLEWRDEFVSTWQHILDGDYDTAATHVLNSAWARETPVRAQDFAAALRALDNY